MELVLTRLLGCGELSSSLDFVFVLRLLGGMIVNWVNGKRIGGTRRVNASCIMHAKSCECAKGDSEYESHTSENPTTSHRRRRTITHREIRHHARNIVNHPALV